MKQKIFSINGKDLTIGEIFEFISKNTSKISISKQALKQCKKSQLFLDKTLKINHRIIYGINTGFGPMANYILPKQSLLQLQKNLVLSHAVGIGEKLPDEFVLAAMLVRLNTLAKGYSGVSVELLNRLKTFINLRIAPIIPEHGAVGTSGDLVQLAHIALALIGKGKVSVQGRITETKNVLGKHSFPNYELKPKEGLSLINGTSVMTGIAALVCHNTETLLNLAVKTGSMALEIVNGYDSSFSEKLSALRPHPGQVKIAAQMRSILASSKLIRNRKELHKYANETNRVNKIPDTVQEFYSLRCITQILGPVQDTLEKSWKETETEMNSVTDNPIIDLESKNFIHGGNFHGEYIAQSMDQLKTGLIKLTMLSERRLNFLLNPNINNGLPPFLNLHTPGLTLGLQGLQFVATSTTANSQTLGYPMSLHSISTNGDNQDVVSMGTDSALFAAKVVENAFVVLAIEIIALCQAVDALKVSDKLSHTSKKLYDFTRGHIKRIHEDRPLQDELANFIKDLKG